MVGWVNSKTAHMDQSNMICPLLASVHKELEEMKNEEKSLIYKLRKPMELVSKYQEFLAKKAESDGIKSEKVEDTKKDQVDSQIFHGWVYVETENLSFFVEPTTGLRHSINAAAYVKINCLFNDQNYWLNLKEGSLSRKGKKLDLDNKIKWLKLVQDLSNGKEDKQKHEKKATEIGIGLMKVPGQGGVRGGYSLKSLSLGT